MTACPSCGEKRLVRMSVTPASNKKPLPVWRYECKKCGREWREDPNVLEAENER